MSRTRLLVAVIAIVGLSTPARAQTAATGLWASEGYGMVFDVRADSVLSFEVTKVSCISDVRAATVPPPPGAIGAFRIGPTLFTILRDRSANDARLHNPFAASDVIMHRIPKKPSTCDAETPNTPISNFDVFAQTWAEQYGFFREHNMDWAAVVAENRSKVNASTTPEELFTIISGMIAPLQDAHSSINARSISKRFGGVRRTPSFLSTPADRTAGYALVSSYLTGPLRQFCEGQVELGMIGSDIGYLRIKSFSRYSSDGAFETGLANLDAGLDTAFANTRGWKGLIIDVRLNGGGADPWGLAIARRLTSARYTAYAKQARNDPADATKWSAEQLAVVEPSTRPSFRGAVIELTGVQSISAAETFTQALINRQPKIMRVGETTQGVFSDVLGRQLPNGWTFGLANERFVTNGKSYDNVGIPVDIAVESFTPEARATGKDAAIERAIALLRTRQ